MQNSRSLLVTSSIVLGCLFAGVGASPALATTRSVTAVAIREQQRLPAPSTSGDVDRQLQAPVAPIEGNQARLPRIPIGPIVSFIKSAGPAIWNACVKAVKAGFAKFKGWWNDLAGWVRTGISWIVNVGLETLFSWLLDWVRSQ